MTLVELLIALTLFTVVIGAAMQYLRAQSQAYRRGTAISDAVANLRYAEQTLLQDLRIAGANVPDHQPVLVYAANEVVSINADYASNLPGALFAVYRDPDAPAGQVSAASAAGRFTIPRSSPTVQYPDTTYLVQGSNSEAETITFYFEPDGSTIRADDWVLRRQVNAADAEVVARGILAVSGTPFFRYQRLARSGSRLVLAPVPAGWIPLYHQRPIHLSPADTGAAARIDSVRAILVTFDVTNGAAGSDERVTRAEFTIPLPNMGIARLRSCGDPPLSGSAFTAAVELIGGAPTVRLSWTASADESAGERDVSRYVLWRRAGGVGEWGDPYRSIPAGNASYVFSDEAVEPGVSYQYALASQDCTPTLSPRTTSALVLIP
jgi:type II secretory pathway pseudopilin PulG